MFVNEQAIVEFILYKTNVNRMLKESYKSSSSGLFKFIQ
jgi:hypothetical protein